MRGNDTVEMKLSLSPEMAILFFRLLTLKDDGDFWKEFADACVAHSSYLGQQAQSSPDRERDARVMAQLKDTSRLMEEVSP